MGYMICMYLLSFSSLPFCFVDGFYLCIHERHKEAEGEGEAGRESYAGLNPGSPGSRPGLKAALNRWATGAALLILL